ncbi:MAG: YgjV family protein [Candidatus Gracilibacteria bacterium]|nr:YgjV family protein [Candidatus Gracilibacteria bacterium]
MGIVDLILANPLGQFFGFTAMIIAFIGLIQKDDQKTLKIILISMIFWGIHFYTMQMYSALAVNIIGIIRLFLSLKYKRNKRIFLGVISVTIVLGFVTYDDIYSVLPIIGSCISAYGYFFFERIRLRVFMFISSLFRFTFCLNYGLIGGTINEVITQIILIVAMYKLIHEEGKRVYFVDRVISIISHPKPDIGRFIDIYDFIQMNKISLKERYLNSFKKYREKFIISMKSNKEKFLKIIKKSS